MHSFLFGFIAAMMQPAHRMPAFMERGGKEPEAGSLRFFWPSRQSAGRILLMEAIPPAAAEDVTAAGTAGGDFDYEAAPLRYMCEIMVK